MNKLKVTESVTYDLITDNDGKTIAFSNREDVTRLILCMDEVKDVLINMAQYARATGFTSKMIDSVIENLENKSIEEVLK